MQIRLFVREDAKAVGRIERECFPKEPWSVAQYLKAIDTPNKAMFVAVDEDEIHGFILSETSKSHDSSSPWSDNGHILSVAVKKASRGRGVARLLMDVSERFHRDVQRHHMLSLFVEHTNESALRLYRGIGYSPLTKVHDYYGKGRDAVVMAKVLAQ